MKRITFWLLLCFIVSQVALAQTLNQNASWPSTAWTVTGTYNAVGFQFDPTTTSNFMFDDDDAGNGSNDNIEAESPVIDLTAAFNAGETWLTISGDYVYRYLADDELKFQYWDADASMWIDWGFGFSQSTAGAPTSAYCAAAAENYTSSVLTLVNFTTTQLSGFKYRISYDDNPNGADYNYGFCFQSPTITSETPPTCAAPTNLSVANIDGFSAEISWSELGTASLYNIELVDITAGDAVTGTPTTTGVTNPFDLTALTPDNDYEYYVQADCGTDGTSPWSGPLAFSTTVACPNPSGLGVSNISTDSATLSWTAGASETLWDIELVDITAGDAATDVATASGVSNPYIQNTLVANNDYEFYVRADCSPNGTSDWVGPFAFTTSCNAIAAPYTEDFETFTVSTSAFTNENCWAGTNIGGYLWEVAATTDTSSADTGPASGISDGNYLFTEATSGTTGDAIDFISPLIDLSALTAPSVTFDYHMYGAAMGTLDIIVDLNGVETVELSLVGEQQTSAGDPFITQTVDLAAYAGETIQVIFRGTKGVDFTSDMSIDTIVFDEVPACIAPSMLTVSSVTDTTADFGWTAGDAETLWNIELVDITAGETQTSTATTSGVANPYTQTGLTPENDYEYYVQADCGGDVSSWSGPVSFTTACAAIAAPYTEDFESFTTSTSAFTDENCWTAVNDVYFWESAPGTDAGSSDTGPDSSITTGNYFYTEATSGVTGSVADLNSPSIDLSALTDTGLIFDYHMFGADTGSLEVLVNGTDSVLLLTGQQQTSATEPFITRTIDLTAYSGQTIFVTFRATRGADFTSDISIDNVSFDDACLANAGTLTADADEATLMGGTATLTATPNGDSVVPTDYDVTYVLTSGDNLVIEQVSTTPSFDVTTIGNFTLHTLVAETSDSADPNFLDLSGVNFGTTTAQDVIDIVVAGDLCASLDAVGAPVSVGDGSILDFYNVQFVQESDFSGMNGSSTSVTVEIGTSITAFAQAYELGLTDMAGQASGIECWIAINDADTDPETWDPSLWQIADYQGDVGNNDEYFIETADTPIGSYYVAARWRLNNSDFTYGGFNGPWNGTDNNNIELIVEPLANDECDGAIDLTVNPDYSCAIVTMGTTAFATASPQPDDATGTPNNDVWFTFTATNDAHRISLLNVTAVVGTSTDMGMSVFDDADGCNMTAANEVGESDPNILNLTGLTSGNIYYVRVYGWSSSVDFTAQADFDICVGTEPTCFVPDNLAAAFVDPDSANVSWDAPTDGTAPVGYNWEVVPQGNAQGVGVISSGNTTDLFAIATGLTADTLYDLRVQSDCGAGDTSVYSDAFTFNAGYCIPVGTSDDTFINNFSTTGGAENISNLNSGIAVDNYENNTGTMTVRQASNGTFDFEITIVGGTVGTALWIDWNNDFVFDTTEALFSTTSYSNGPFTGTITVPDATPDGDYRMRVMTDWNDPNPGDDAPCSFGLPTTTTPRGEVEDYTVTVDETLSTNSFDNEIAFTYFPNPVKNELVLNAQNNIQNVAVLNMLGQEVLSAQPNTVDSTIDMNGLSQGAYFVKVTIGNTTETIRIIKQ
ncbi:MAG: fibronectin type III domain-containing protein [Psychroserpens sp.]|uniref:fibronectin type III domain-containing protein n=1 Tax=Psychroserpens sp. TaxID=2020870 RepID=UPI003C9E99C5